ncbi:unnamed protein product [Meloidogyne enterolobii]|uniref:Uncharacterized protein n=1 Tax=Meloidogyne enterolobii TaxID=390850 RepID=A0ACB0Z5T3_MELEN
MNLSNAGIIRQNSSTSTRQSSGSGQQQQPPIAGSWRCEVFVDTPITRELMHGPLNIHLPPLPLPSGLTTFMEHLTNNTQQGEHQPALAAVTDVSLDEQRPLQQPQSPTSVTPTHGRAHSTPAALNSSDGSSNGSGSSFVINMEDDLSRVTNQLHRRRSSSPLRNMHNDAASSNGVIPSFSPQLTQRTPTINAATGTRQEGDDQNTVTTVAVASGASDASGGSGDSDEDEDPTLRNLRNRFRQLLRRRHQILRNFIQQMGEFPSLYVFGVLVCWTLVILSVLLQFFTIEFTACLALLFCFFHYSDVVAFKRYISGTGNGWFIGGKIALRQFMVLQVLGQSSFVFPAATFRETSVSFINNPSFWSTLYIVLVTEYFVLDCLLAAKLLVANLPKCSTVYKRRLYQWLEYSGALYRFALPFVQWNAYLGALWWTVVYGGIKILLSFAMIWGWILTTLRIFRFTHLGTTPTPSECKQNENCTICFSEYTSPVKLKCSHIFCSECIRTWLDREHTCPICRTIVTKEDNNYRNGESMFPCIF